MPTSAYINYYKDAYSNPNITTWEQLGEKPVKNAILNQDDPECAAALKLVPENLIGHHNIKPVLPSTLRPPIPAPESPGAPPDPPLPPIPDFSDLPEDQRPYIYPYFTNPPPIRRPIHNLGPAAPPSLPNAPPFDRPPPNAPPTNETENGTEINEDATIENGRPQLNEQNPLSPDIVEPGRRTSP